MTPTQIVQESSRQIIESANRYETVNLTSSDYTPDEPFRAVHVSGDGNITIEGIDGKQATIAVVAGLYPFGGRKIIRATTTATGITALR